jgi:hypothetical protein
MIQYNKSVNKSDIYIYFLKEEGKNPFYVGKTNNPEKRFRCHFSQTQHHSNIKKNEIISDIKKRGANLIMNVFWGGSLTEWRNEEIFWISKLKHDWQILICNIHKGGDGVEFTDEIKAKMSLSKKGKKLSDATRNKMKGRKVWNKGLKIHETLKVNQLTISGTLINTFDSIKEAGEKLNINRGNISLVVNGKRKTIGGYVFKYANN